MFDWLKSKAALIEAKRTAEDDCASVSRANSVLQDRANEWRMKYEMDQNLVKIREALKLAEEENARLYLIIYELRKSRVAP